MRAGTVPDHGSLALLAQNQATELRPLLLRVHVRNFADAPRRDPVMVASFEAIALGLIPLVPDDVLADAAAMLRDAGDVPAAVRILLEERLGREDRAGSADPSAMDETSTTASDPDLESALDTGCRLEPSTLSRLVDRAARNPELALVLLERPEPTPFDRAALYRHANDETRASIRRNLHLTLSGAHIPAPTAMGHAAREVLEAAERGDARGVIDALAARLGVDPTPFDLDRPAGQELVLFAMIAIGLNDAECVRALLRLDQPLSRSVEVVFRLAALARETPRAVAAFLVGHERVAPARQLPPDTSPHRAAGTLRADGRADPIPRPRRLDRQVRDPAPSVRLDRRS